jgi:hypothetical protein
MELQMQKTKEMETKIYKETKLVVGYDHFICPISLKIMDDPVMASDGFTYERVAIEEWLQKHSTSPSTKVELINKDLVCNRVLKKMLDAYKQELDKTSRCIKMIENIRSSTEQLSPQTSLLDWYCMEDYEWHG